MIQSYAATNQPPSIQRPALPGTMRAALWAMCVLGLLFSLSHGATTLNRWLGVAAVTAGLVAVTALWQRSSGRYFESFRRPRS